MRGGGGAGDAAGAAAEARSDQQMEVLAKIATRLDEIAAMMREKR